MRPRKLSKLHSVCFSNEVSDQGAQFRHVGGIQCRTEFCMHWSFTNSEVYLYYNNCLPNSALAHPLEAQKSVFLCFFCTFLTYVYRKCRSAYLYAFLHFDDPRLQAWSTPRGGVFRVFRAFFTLFDEKFSFFVNQGGGGSLNEKFLPKSNSTTQKTWVCACVHVPH